MGFCPRLHTSKHLILFVLPHMYAIMDSSSITAGSLMPKIERGFHSACADLKPQRRFLVYSGSERFPLDDKRSGFL